MDIYFFYLFYSFYRQTYKKKDTKKICVIFFLSIYLLSDTQMASAEEGSSSSPSTYVSTSVNDQLMSFMPSSIGEIDKSAAMLLTSSI